MSRWLLHGNSPTVKTGYGIQIAQLAESLVADGHEVACSSTYGLQGSIEQWRGIRVYGCGYDVNSNDRIHMHAQHWFDNEPGWIVTCLDVWAMENPLLAEFNVAAWVPIDHFTAVGPQPNVVEFFKRTNAVPVAMSHFGEDLLLRAGLDPVYVPLSVDTSVYKPTERLVNGKTWREFMGYPDDAYIVGMVAMNKGWARDRKGFNEAFWAFGLFQQDHPNAYLYVHADAPGGAEGINLRELAVHSGIPEHKIKFAGGPNQYGYYLGFTGEAMAAMYTGIDALLAPSHGEGFCVPLVESEACGTPVIATDFSAQSELVPEGTGWLVQGQPEWDPAHHALYKVPLIMNVVAALEESFDEDRAEMAAACIANAAQYDTQYVYENHWKPFIADVTGTGAKLALEREAMPDEDAVAVLCPIAGRTKNIAQLAKSFTETTGPGEASLYFILDDGTQLNVTGDNIHAISGPASTCAEKWNLGYQSTTEPWVLCIGDDVVFHEGWLDHARKLSSDFDVIGTNDSLPGRIRNPKVASGAHSDHTFYRRVYVEEYGACLNGPGVLAPEEYNHWFVDMEMVGLARARGVFSPCPDCVVEHLHPGYDGDEAARQADPTYMRAVEHSAEDEATFNERWPLVQMARTARGRA